MHRSISQGDARIDFTIRLWPRPKSDVSNRVRIGLLTGGRVDALAPGGSNAEAVVRAADLAAARRLVRALLQRCYRQRVAALFARRLALMAAQTGWLTAQPDPRLLNMRTQWGTCLPGRAPIPTSALVVAPSASIDDVLGHERCRLREHPPRRSVLCAPGAASAAGAESAGAQAGIGWVGKTGSVSSSHGVRRGMLAFLAILAVDTVSAARNENAMKI